MTRMTTTVSEFGNVAQRASELGCPVPGRIAILPENFETAKSYADFEFSQEASTIRTLFRNNDFELDEILPPGQRSTFVHNKHFEWAALLFISVGLISSNPMAVSIAIGMISNYATDYFRGMPSKNVKLSIVVEKRKDKSCKKINFDGPVEGLKDLPEIIRRVSDEQ